MAEINELEKLVEGKEDFYSAEECRLTIKAANKVIQFAKCFDVSKIKKYFNQEIRALKIRGYSTLPLID